MATWIWVNIGTGDGLLHQAITWTNVDLSSARSSGIHLRAILQEIPQPSVTEISMKITYLKFCSNIPGTNELMACHLTNVKPLPELMLAYHAYGLIDP